MSEHRVVNLASERDNRRPGRLNKIGRGLANFLEGAGSIGAGMGTIGYIPLERPSRLPEDDGWAKDMQAMSEDFSHVPVRRLRRIK